MKTYNLFFILTFYLVIITLASCRKLSEVNQDPEIEPLKHGFKTSAAVGYCASLAYRWFNGESLPDNVIIQSQNVSNENKSGVLMVYINDSFPLPFNTSVGQITIAGIWGNNGGVITALFTDIDILEAKYEFKGIHTIPVIEMEKGKILTLFAEQDIVIGEGSDTLLHLNLTAPQISFEIDRLKGFQPHDAFVAVQQNVWFITVNQNIIKTNTYDDEYTINGGGQIAEVTSKNGGMLYHAMIGTKFTHSICKLNPVSGYGFIQNLKFGTNTDLGHIFLNFHNNCDGKAFVEFSSGKYMTSNHKNVNLNFY
jgi:hypothetical protein